MGPDGSQASVCEQVVSRRASATSWLSSECVGRVGFQGSATS